MVHNNYISFFRDKAALHHKDLGNGNVTRNCFYQGGALQHGLEELFSIPDDADPPVLILHDYFGNLSKDSTVDDTMTGGFEIRGQFKELNDTEAISALKDTCKRIAFDIIALMDEEYEENGNSGAIPGFSINTVRYDFTGPFHNNWVGCLVQFNIRDQAYNPYQFDKETIYPNLDN